MKQEKPKYIEENLVQPERRDFITQVASNLALAGCACAAWPLLDSMNPSDEITAASVIEIDLTEIAEGQTKVYKWRDKPIFVRNRTAEEILAARNTPLAELIDPEKDEQRVKAGCESWLVVVGVCTHLGCIPIDKDGAGWLCPCHGSEYDTSGRVCKGPAPKNLAVPPYTFLTAHKIQIG